METVANQGQEEFIRVCTSVPHRGNLLGNIQAAQHHADPNHGANYLEQDTFIHHFVKIPAR
jgi:hypothetical protein